MRASCWLLSIAVAGCAFDTSGAGSLGLDAASGLPPDASPGRDAPSDASAPDALPPDAARGPVSLRVEALIDGRSTLTLRRDQAQWHHREFAAPGRHEGSNEPTVLNGEPWFPVWPDQPDAENRNCDCDSQPLLGLAPAIPAIEQLVELRSIDARETARILEQPIADNDYALVIELDDRDRRASATYVVELDFIGTLP